MLGPLEVFLRIGGHQGEKRSVNNVPEPFVFKHQGNHLVSLGLHPAPDSSPYEGKAGLTTPTKSWRNAHIVKALITHLLNAPPSLEEHGRHCHRDKHPLSLYLPGLRKARLQTSTLTAPSNPYQGGLENRSLS